MQSLMENSASIGMANPIFGNLRLRKYHTKSFETNPNVCINDSHGIRSPRGLSVNHSPVNRAPEINPLSTNIFLTNNSLHEVPRNDEYKRDLILAQRELMSAHEEIMKLEAEIKAARLK